MGVPHRDYVNRFFERNEDISSCFKRQNAPCHTLGATDLPRALISLILHSSHFSYIFAARQALAALPLVAGFRPVGWPSAVHDISRTRAAREPLVPRVNAPGLWPLFLKAEKVLRRGWHEPRATSSAQLFGRPIASALSCSLPWLYTVLSVSFG